jgi:hypothetical protein
VPGGLLFQGPITMARNITGSPSAS